MNFEDIWQKTSVHETFIPKHVGEVRNPLHRLQSRCNFGELVLSIFLAKIVAALYNFYYSGRLGREKNLSQRGERQSKGRG